MRVVAIAAGFVLSAGCLVETEQPNLVGQDIRMTFIHTSDIHSRLFPYDMVPNRFDEEDGLRVAPFGGVARIATVAKDIRATAGRSLWLDSGDCFQGAPVFNIFKGEAELRSLSKAGMDGAVVGNHEFDLGSANLFHQIDNWATYPLLAANYLWEDPVNPDQRSLRDVVEPFRIFDVDGLRIGVIGMGNTGSMTGIYEGGNSLGIRPLDERDVLSQYVRLIRPMVDLVVVVSHLGLDEDEGLTATEVQDQNEELPLEGVDLILGGHLHIVTDPPKIIPNDDEGHVTILAHSGAFAKFVGRLDLVVRVGDDNNDPARRSRITAFAFDNIAIDSSVNPDGSPRIPEDPDIAEMLLPYSIEVNRQLDLDGVFAYTHIDLDGNGTFDDKVLRTDRAGGDSQLGNLVARSMQIRPGVEAEFALTNSLGIRADFEDGALTVEQMFNVFPFENSITVMYLSGTEIQDTFDFVAQKSADRGCRSQAQVSGIFFDMVCTGDCSGPEHTRRPDGSPYPACAKNIFLGDDCRAGNPDGPIDPALCRQVVPSGLYRVAVNDYIARGGSGFSVLKRNSSKQDTGVPLRDSLQVFLRSLPACDESVMEGGERVIDKYGAIPCIGAAAEPHDGRIRPVFE
jgi:2',3'-cyclic-nucleotide 2'-phosphodiesterase (5'-nucleotidase family)